MHHYSLLQLREMSDALSTVAQVLETNPFYLRSKQIRQVDKALQLIESLTPDSLIQEARLWKETFEGKGVLENKLMTMDQTQKKIETMEKQIEALQQETRCWYGLEDDKRTAIVEHAKRASEFIRNQGDISEADVIQRYNRSLELKQILPYADKAAYLCDAIYYFTQKNRTHQNLEKLNHRISAVHSRMKTVSNGFYVALALCVLVATIPICVPFSITLWGRKQKLKSHLIVYEDLLRRENKRLELADEGEKIIYEIQSMMGNLSYENIKELLMEAKSLKEEFYDSERFLSVCAMILSFIDTEQEALQKIFGNIPNSPHDRFEWLVQNVNKFESAYKELEELLSEKHDLCLRKKQTTKGYERTILTDGIKQLSDSMKSLLNVPIAPDYKAPFVEMCLQVHDLNKKIRESIYFANQNYDVSLEEWNTAKSCYKQYSQNLALYVLDSEINVHLDPNKSLDNVTTSLNNTQINKEVLV